MNPEDRHVSIEGHIETKVQNFFNQLLPYDQLTPSYLSSATPSDVYVLLKLSNKYRLGDHPQGNARDRNIEVVKNSIETDEPIPIVVTIGTSKWYDGSHTESNVANLSEVLMLEQLSHMDRRIKHYFQPGLSITLLAEDITNQWLYGLMFPHVNIAINNMTYLTSVNLLVSTFRNTTGVDVQLVLEQELLKRQDITFKNYVEICERNRNIFSNLFQISRILEEKYLSSHGLLGWTDNEWNFFVRDVLSKTDEYILVNSVGWRGGVHPNVRAFYLHQFEKSTGVQEDGESYLAAYFGGVLARKQLNILKLASDNKKFIKVAFLRYPSGSTKESNNAIQVSQHPLTGFGSSHHHISPWASHTQIAINEKGVCRLRVIPAKNEDTLLTDAAKHFRLHYHGINIPIDVVSDL